MAQVHGLLYQISQARVSSPFGSERFPDNPPAPGGNPELKEHGLAPAITAKGENLFDVPYITRILVRKPKDVKNLNGTVVIEPFTWIGQRGAGWMLTKDYLLRAGYASVRLFGI